MKVLNEKTEQIWIFQTGKNQTKYLENNLTLFFSFLDINNLSVQLNKFNKMNPLALYILV